MWGWLHSHGSADLVALGYVVIKGGGIGQGTKGRDADGIAKPGEFRQTCFWEACTTRLGLGGAESTLVLADCELFFVRLYESTCMIQSTAIAILV